MADQEFKIRIISEADNSGVRSSAQAHEELRGETQRLSDATNQSAKSAEQDFLKRNEQKRILLEIGNVVAPGTGAALMELAMGPVGAGLALVGVYELLKKVLEQASEEADKVAEAAAKPQTGGIEALRTAWENAAKATGAYYAAMQTAGTDNDPVATQIKRAKELADAQTEASKKIVTALGEETVARLRAAGATQAQIDTAQKQTQMQLDALDKTHEHAVGSDALQKEQQERLGQNDRLQREANDAITAQRAENKKYADKQAEIGNLKNELGQGSEGKKNTTYANEQAEFDKLKKEYDQRAKQYNGGDSYVAAYAKKEMDRLQEEMDKITGARAKRQDRLNQLEQELPADERAKAAADAKASAATGASENNQSRLRQLTGEIDQAKKVEATRDHAQDVINVLNSTSGRSTAKLGEVATAIGLTEQQKLAIVERILAHQMTTQQAWAGIERRLQLLERQGRSVSFNSTR